MKIHKLEISGFRGVDTGSVVFGNTSILIGANDSGKTTVLEAIALLLGRDRMVRTLTEHDFYGSDPRPADRIRLIATLTAFEPNDPSEHPDWFRASRGVAKWIRSTDGELVPAPESEHDQLAVQVAVDARFDHETLDVETIRYFYDASDTGDCFDNESVTPLPGYLIREIGFFLVPASRTWDRMMSFGSELFRRLVNYVGGKPATTILSLRDELRFPKPEIQDDKNINNVIGEIDDDLTAILGRETNLKLRLTTGDSLSILGAIEPHFNAETGQALPSARHGAGLISLQSLVLLLRFGKVRTENGDPFILAVEEPELHVPPPLQRRIAQRIQSLSSQSILTTHSPVVASHGKAADITLLRKEGGKLTAFKLTATPLTRESNAVDRKLFQTGLQETVSALMHKHIIIPEGPFDRDYLDMMGTVMSAAQSEDASESAFGTQVGVLATPDARMRDAFSSIQAVHGSIACLVDGDAGGDAHLEELLVAPCPATIVQWPVGWAIEAIIGWIIEAEPQLLIDPILVELGFPAEVADVVDLLSTNTNRGGLKGDRLAVEPLISILGQSRACRDRMKIVLDALFAAASGNAEQTATLVASPLTTQRTSVWVFAP